MLRDWLTEVRANVVTTIVQPGRFTAIESGVTIRIRERRNNGQLLGIFLDDRRDPAERVTVLAEAGELLDNDNGTFLVLQKGMVQRQQASERDPAMVVFDRYAFDLSQFAGGPQAVKYSIRERYLWQLLFPDPKDPALRRAAGTVPRRTVRPPDGAALSARLPGDRLRLSRRAAHQPAKPHVVAVRRHRRRRAAAPDRLRLHRVRRELPVDGVAAIRRARSSPSRSASTSSAAASSSSRPPSSPIGSPRSPSASAAASQPRNVTMPIFAGTLARYFGLRFLGAVLLVFAGIFVLIALLDYIELMRRAADIPHVSALLVAKTSLYRVPQVTERIMPFCVLIGAMSCYLNLSRRLELVIARASGMSAWQFIAPALVVAFVIGVVATTLYNPISAVLQERSKRFEAELFGENQRRIRRRRRHRSGQASATTPGRRSSTPNRAATRAPNSAACRSSPSMPPGTSRSASKRAPPCCKPGVWQLLDARVYALGTMPVDQPVYLLKTSLTPEQARESFATPETVPFWELPSYITIAEHAGLVAAGYRLQFQKLLARPFLLAAMVFLAAAVSLRFFRFGGVQKMVLSGVAAGFLLYVLSKVTEDLSKADLLHPVAAAWLPVFVGGLTGFIALLYQEDG